MADPVFYSDGTQHADPLYQGDVVDGKLPAGWYFANETWSDQFGPYDTEQKCREELDRYCEVVLGV